MIQSVLKVRRAMLVLVLLAVLYPDPISAATGRGADEVALGTMSDRASVGWLVGVWQRRDAQLVVPDTDIARLRWRTDWCSMADRPPCDHFEGEALVMGALADLRLGVAQGSAPHATGAEVEAVTSHTIGAEVEAVTRHTIGVEVEAVTAEGLLVVGPLLLLRLDDDLIELRQGTRAIQLCRAPRELDFCDERWW
jgi:hypothetical protein